MARSDQTAVRYGDPHRSNCADRSRRSLSGGDKISGGKHIGGFLLAGIRAGLG
jgi:hypothetical protein